MASTALPAIDHINMENISNKSSPVDSARIPGTPVVSSSVPPPAPSKVPQLPAPNAPLSLRAHMINSSNDALERAALKASTTTAASSLAGIGMGSSSTANGSGLQTPTVQGNGLPSLVFPPTTQQAYHTRNLLLHIYSMFNGAQAAIHQLGANCEFNQNLITFLSNQIQEKDRKIQTLTASVNMLQIAVQRAMRNNDELKKSEEGLQEEIKTLQKSVNGGSSNGSSDSEREQDLKYTTRIKTLTEELDSQKAKNADLIMKHDALVSELQKELAELKENVEILEESLTLSVSGSFENGMWHFKDLDEALSGEDTRNDESRGEKMLNGRLEDTSFSDDSLIEEVNVIAPANGDHIIYTDGACNGASSPVKRQYLDSIIEEPEEEEKENSCGNTGTVNQLGYYDGCSANQPAPRKPFVLRATAAPFINYDDYYTVPDNNREDSDDGLTQELCTSFL